MPTPLQSVKDSLLALLIRPRWDDKDNTVTCTEEQCPSFDGKRCTAMGFRPSSICEPAVAAMMTALGTDDDREDKTWPDVCTAAGHGVWFLHPERTTVDPVDLQVHLPRIFRYNGALPWTDLQHLALCVRLARDASYTREAISYVAAHDLHEAYIGDQPTHMKRHLHGWREIEAAWEAHVHTSLGLSWPLDAAMKAKVKHIDRQALCIEMSCLGHVMADGVAERRGVVVSETMRSAWADVANVHDDHLWAILQDALPSLTKRFQ